MLDSRVLAAIVLMGITALGIKVVELIEWHVNRRPIINTQTNGGVKAGNAWSGTSQTR